MREDGLINYLKKKMLLRPIWRERCLRILIQFLVIVLYCIEK